MKTRYSLLLALVGMSRACLGQAPFNLLSLNVPGGTPTNLRPQYERVLGPVTSLGVRGAWYFGGAWPGWQLEAFGRCYTAEAAPRGLYLQYQVGYFRHHGLTVGLGPPPGFELITKPLTVSSYGGGLGIGYQWLPGVGRHHLVLDAMAGFKLYLQPNSFRDEGAGYVGDWYTFGPGSIFNGRLGLGYAF